MMAHDNEILTAYLDGDLEPQERREVEARLEAQPELRAQLDALRAASQAVRNLPRKKAPASILASVRGEIARGTEGKGQVIRAGEQFKPAKRPNRWRSGLISAAAMLAVGVMIFVAVKPTLLHGPKEQMSADTRTAKSSDAAPVTQAARETRALAEAEKPANTKADALSAREESDALDRYTLPNAKVPAAEPPANKAFETGEAGQALAKKDLSKGAYRAATTEEAKGFGAMEASGADKKQDLARSNAAPAEPDAPKALGATGAGGGSRPARTLDEQKVATRDSNDAKTLDGAAAAVTETAAARSKSPAPAPKPAAMPGAPPPPAAPSQEAAKAGIAAGPEAAKAKAYAGAVEKKAAEPAGAVAGGKDQEQLALANTPAAKPADGKPNTKSEFKKESADKAEGLAAAGVPAKAAPQAEPTVIRLRAGDLGQARADLLALAAAQGGRELAQARQAGDAERRRGFSGPAGEEDEAKRAGELLVAEALKKSEEQLRAPADRPAEGEGRAEEAKEGVAGLEPLADAAKQADAEPDAAAELKRKATEEGARESKNAQFARDPAGQSKVVRLVLQVPASKKAALLAALQKQANRSLPGRQGDTKGAAAPGDQGGGAEPEASKAPEVAERERTKTAAIEQPKDASLKDERLEGGRQPAPEPRAPEAAAAEPLEIIEVLIELVP